MTIIRSAAALATLTIWYDGMLSIGFIAPGLGGPRLRRPSGASARSSELPYEFEAPGADAGRSTPFAAAFGLSGIYAAVVTRRRTAHCVAMRAELRAGNHLGTAAERLVQAARAEVEGVAVENHSKLIAAITKLDETVIAGNRIQRLQWAIANAEMFSFHYLAVGGIGRCNSKEKVVAVLGAFMIGCGLQLAALKLEHSDADGAMFRAKLGDQIHRLTGKKPRFALQDNDSWGIFEE